MDKNKLKKIFADDPEMLRLLESQDQTELMRAILKERARSDIEVKMTKIEYLKGDKGDPLTWDDLTDEQKAFLKGEKGDTPEKGVDYFTEDEVRQVAEYVKKTVKEEVRPKKGIDYNDGKDADEKNIIKSVLEKMPSIEDIASHVKLPELNRIDKELLFNEFLGRIPQPISISVEDVVKEIKQKRLIELRDIKGARLDRASINMNDQRWHGGGGVATSINGLISAGSNITITGTGISADPYVIAATGGGSPGGSDTQVQFNDSSAFGGDAGFTYNKTTDVATIGGLLLSGQTASTIAIFDGSKNVISADTATYPSLTELSYVKGVTSSIQTQLNGKQATLTPAALTRVDDTNVTLTLGGTPATSLLQAVSLTLGWTGTLALARGGTGLSAIAALSIWVANSANTLVALTPGAGNSIRINAAGNAWEAYTPAAGGSPGGADTQVQFNDGGAFGGDSGFTYNKTSNVVTMNGVGSGQVGTLNITRGDSVNQYIVLTESASSTGSVYLTFAGSNPGAMAMGALFTAGVPTSYVFTDTNGATMMSIAESTGRVNIASLTASEIMATDGSKNLVSLAVATYPSLAELAFVKGVTSAIQTQINTKGATAGQVWTGVHDFTGATSLAIPVSAAPTVNADGEIAFDTTVADFSPGVIRFYGNEEQGIVSMPIAEFSSPSNGDLVTYNSTTDEFELAQPVAVVPTQITVANEATDTSCFVAFFAAASGNLEPKTNANMTFNSNTGVVTFASSILTTTDINGGTIDGAIIGGASAAAGTFTAIVGTSLSIGTGGVATMGTIELGAASDTTIARSAAGQISVEGVQVVTISNTVTLTNKRITERVQSVADAATITPNADSDDCVDITAIAQAFTIANASGTPTNFQRLRIRIKDNGTARAITWGADYVSGGSTLPTTTVLSKIMNLGFQYNTANGLNKWQLVALAQEA